MGLSSENVTSNNPSECILDTLKLANVCLCGAKKQGIGIVQPGAHEGRGCLVREWGSTFDADNMCLCESVRLRD